MYGVVRRALFTLDAETAHAFAHRSLAPLQRGFWPQALLPKPPDPRLANPAFGLPFPGPLGIAAGFDKEARLYNALLALGFGHVELGTVTPRPQPGNERPRIERHPRHKALVNRMGFPGPGAQAIAGRIAETPTKGIVGANIGPNKDTPAVDVHADLAGCAALLGPVSSYLAINVSSPNTPGLRALQEPKAVARLVTATRDASRDAAGPDRVLLKLHPDAPDEELVQAARAAVDAGACGIIATNTTRSRPEGVRSTMEGGLSGKPLRPRSVAAVAALHKALGRDVPIIGVGGIFTADDAWQHIRAGASVLQTYTGFVYEGPGMAGRIHRGLVRHLDEAGLDRIGEAVGLGLA